MQSAILSTHRLKKQFRQGNTSVRVLDDVSVSFTQGKTYSITGVSGTGKSTFIHLLAGLDTPSGGQVRFNKKNLATFAPAEQSQFLNQKIGLVFQQPYLIRELSVLENIMVPGMIAGHSDCKARAQKLLADVGLLAKATHKPASLSGGEQQRVALARALCNKPAFLLADELTGNLDIETGRTIVSLLAKLQKEYHMGIVVCTHDQYVAQSMQERFELRNGHLRLINKS